MMPLKSLKLLAKDAEKHLSFIAQKTVLSMAIPSLPENRIICKPGDKIVLHTWYCHEGPTSLTVYRLKSYTKKNWLGRKKVVQEWVKFKESCIPFCWVLEALPPNADLIRTYMPIVPGKTWQQIIDNYPESME